MKAIAAVPGFAPTMKAILSNSKKMESRAKCGGKPDGDGNVPVWQQAKQGSHLWVLPILKC